MITTVQQKQSYKWIYHFSVSSNIFAVLTVFGALFPLFCDALGMSKTQIGFVVSILPLLYITSIFLSNWIMRCGPRRIFLRAYSVRYCILLLLPLAALVANRYGNPAVFLWVALIIFCFGVFRAIGDTAWLIWTFELISAKVRGKVDAISAMAGICGMAMASLAAIFIIKNWPGLAGFQAAMYAGVLFGFIGLACATRLPGGQAQTMERESLPLISSAMETLRNVKFRHSLLGNMFMAVTTATFVFLPLYLREQIGFSVDKIMFFSFCFQLGILFSAFFWGWSADRFGSKPVMVSAMLGWPILPFLLFMLPRMEMQSIAQTGLVYAFFGILWQGYFAGTTRYFYVDVLPTLRNPAFATSLNIAVQSVALAVCSLFHGRLLDVLQPFRHDWRFIHFDNYTALFAIMLFCCLGAIIIFRRAPADSPVWPGRFLSFFLEGNPLLAFSSIFRYHFAEDESQRVEFTGRMGDARSLLTVEELLQSAADPNFSVRYEAIVSMARMPPDAKLIDTLAAALRSREPGLSEAAVWALGRMGDRRATPVLREMLKCEYALLRSQCARALAKLNDQESVPEIIAAFKSEKNDNVRAGYAAALGRLRRQEMLPEFMALLRRLADEHLRGEVLLAIARISGSEHHLAQLWRRSRSDFETTCAEEMMDIEKKIVRGSLAMQAHRKLIAACARSFEQRDPAAAGAVRRIIGLLPPDSIDPAVRDILRECDELIARHGAGRGDYILLALNALHMAIVSLIHAERKKKL
ncbi:MAG: MFS transporter [Kiritimatiellae bacterium]|nr:MFS transporter [Kiritimatiellia bacterium]